jgi:hypothetical protein
MGRMLWHWPSFYSQELAATCSIPRGCVPTHVVNIATDVALWLLNGVLHPCRQASGTKMRKSEVLLRRRMSLKKIVFQKKNMLIPFQYIKNAPFQYTV